MLKPRTYLITFLLLLLTVTPVLSAAPTRQDEPGEPNLDARVEEVFAQLTVEERVGQLFLVDFVGQDSSAASAIAQFISQYKIGGVVLFWGNNNIANDEPDTISKLVRLTNGLQRVAHEAAESSGGTFLPLFVALDHEGDGSPRTHLRDGASPIPSAMTLGATWSLTDTQAVGELVGRELAVVGVNLLLGPVVDVLESPRPEGAGDINIRAFGGDPYWVGQLGRAYIRGVHQGSNGRVLTVAKHFPGHGASDRLPDDEVATVNKSLEELKQSDLIPFFEITRTDPDDPLGVTDAMMPSHIRYRGFQGDVSQLTSPISLDPLGMAAFMQLDPLAQWRQTGLVVCDSLGVEAVKSYYDPSLDTFPYKQVARDALLAGNDLLPIVNYALEGNWFGARWPNMQETIDYFQDQYRTDPRFRRRADQAVRQVLRAKLSLYPDLRLEDALVSEDEANKTLGQGDDVVRQVAEHALTLLHPSPQELRARLPQPPRFDQNVLIAGCFEDCLRARLTADGVRDGLLQLYGPQGSGQLDPERVSTLDYAQLYQLLTGEISQAPNPDPEDESLSLEQAEEIREQIEEADWIVLTLINYMPDTVPKTGAARDFLRSADFDLRDKKVVAISFHAPYYLDATEISKLSAYWAVYSKIEPCMEVAWRALFQEVSAPGAPPVSVEGISYDLQTQLSPDPDQDVRLSLLSPPETQLPPRTDVVVQTSPLVNRNGQIVRDGTAVEFDAYYPDLNVHLSPKSTSTTVDGVARAVFQPALEGELEIVARVDGAASRPVALSVALATAPPSQTVIPPTTPPAVPPTVMITMSATPSPPQPTEPPSPSPPPPTATPTATANATRTAEAAALAAAQTETARPPSPTPAGGQSGSGGIPLAGLALALLGLAGLGGAAWWWRRRPAQPAAPPPSPQEAPEPPAVAPDDVTASVELPVPPSSLIGQTLGSCRIKQKIGQGGMGQVYKAYQPLLDRTVAIKVLPSSLVESQEMRGRFRQEARAAANLRHANIIQVHDFGVQGELIYMVMEYVDGQSLKERLAELRQAGERMPLPEALDLIRQVADALAYAHASGAIHRDVKPANILLTRDGQPVLADFGLVILQGGARFTAPDTLWGSPAYMAPELLEGDRDADERSDVYALGIVFYEMLVGRSPFDVESVSKLIWQQIHVEPTPPSELVDDLPEAVDRIVLKMLAKDPGQRYPTAADLISAMDDL